MSVAYVYAPYTAWALVYGGHNDCSGGQKLMDLSRDNTQGLPLDVYVNYPSVKSVKFERLDNCCNICGQDIQNAVKVKLYGAINKQCYFGAILYGHLNNPIAAGWKNLGSSWAGRVGYVVNAPGNCTCYTGEHVHLEVWGGQRLVSNYAYVYKGSTPIYKWTFGC